MVPTEIIVWGTYRPYNYSMYSYIGIGLKPTKKIPRQLYYIIPWFEVCHIGHTNTRLEPCGTYHLVIVIIIAFIILR